ncbi:MAG: transporter [Syntrophobacteraceae bacterium]
MKLKTVVTALALIVGIASPSAYPASSSAQGPQGAVDLQSTPAGETPAHGSPFPHPFAPLGVPGSHVLKPGKWMFAYTYGHMAMDGNLSGTRDVSVAEILQKYPVAPESMDVDMHMFCAMHGITDRFTAMVMVPYLFKSMTMVMRNGTRFTTYSDGIGDVQLSGLYSIYRDKMHQVVFNGGLSLPTGSIDVRDDTPTALNSKLGYTMQLGSGTVDSRPGPDLYGQV